MIESLPTARLFSRNVLLLQPLTMPEKEGTAWGMLFLEDCLDIQRTFPGIYRCFNDGGWVMYELTSTSQFLTTKCKDGIKLKKPDKASLTRELVSQLPQETRNVKSDAQMTIVDFMALVKRMGRHTFGELAESLSSSILATGSTSTRIYIMFYLY